MDWRLENGMSGGMEGVGYKKREGEYKMGMELGIKREKGSIEREIR